MNPLQKPHRLKIRASISVLLPVPDSKPAPSFINPGCLWIVRQTAYAYPCSLGNFAVGLLTDSLLVIIGFSPVLVCIRQVVASPIFITLLMVLDDPTPYEVSMLTYVFVHYALQDRHNNEQKSKRQTKKNTPQA